MGFTYHFCDGTQDSIDIPRMLAGDTQQDDGGSPLTRLYIFDDLEILGFVRVQGMVFQSSQFYSDTAGRFLPQQPVSYLRVAAIMLDAIASNQSRMAMTQLLDSHVNFKAASDALRAQANQWREIDDNSAAFAVIEQSTTTWTFRDRFWAQIQRQSAL